MFVASVLKPLSSWKKEGPLAICIGIDIGGSGLRIRISNALNIQQFIDLPHIRAQSTNEAQGILRNLQKALKEAVADFVTKGSAIAVAGPLKGNTCILTNWPGDASGRTIVLDQLPPTLFPPGRCVLLNDLEAGAYGVIAANDQKQLEPLFQQLWTDAAPKGPIVSNTRTAVLAMGSGFGGALIVKNSMLPEPLVLPTEIGHIQIPPVCEKDDGYQLEHALIQHVSNHYYEGKQMPEYEDVASGRGLCIAYQFFKRRYEKEHIPIERLNAGEIADMAKHGNKIAREALLWHYKLFIRAVKAVGTSLCCDSVLLALDNQVKNAWFIASASDKLRQEFYTFIRPDWMKGIRVYSQKEVLNFNVLGTDYMAHSLAKRK
jgi:glucokinase